MTTKVSRSPSLSVLLLVVLAVITAFLVIMAVNHTGNPPAPVPSTRVVFIGDSYSQGSSKWPDLVARTKGWIPINLARGGTGYRNTGSKDVAMGACGRPYCPNFAQMAPTAIRQSPDIVIVAGGRNDGHADATAGIRETFSLLRDGLPHARIIAIRPMWDASSYPPFLERYGQTIKASVQAVHGEYIDIGNPLQGRPELVRTDGVHPTAEGQGVLADAVLAGLDRSSG